MSRVVVNEIQAKVGNDISFNDAAKIDTLKGKTTAGSITVQGEGTATTNLQQGLAKVWCAYRGNGEALNDSLNVSGLTDHANGDDTHSFTNNMSHANYCYAGSVLVEYAASGNATYTLNTKEDTDRSSGYRGTGSHRLQSAYTNASTHFQVGDWGAQDGECTAITHGDLA
tara:strand:+ start:881 stop:1390 length:510 start_codon:yes stop_codon:yes gene_type:complete